MLTLELDYTLSTAVKVKVLLISFKRLILNAIISFNYSVLSASTYAIMSRVLEPWMWRVRLDVNPRYRMGPTIN
jgi:hypothetical protein